jgi:hypothetical protein
MLRDALSVVDSHLNRDSGQDARRWIRRRLRAVPSSDSLLPHVLSGQAN